MCYPSQIKIDELSKKLVPKSSVLKANARLWSAQPAPYFCIMIDLGKCGPSFPWLAPTSHTHDRLLTHITHMTSALRILLFAIPCPPPLPSTWKLSSRVTPQPLQLGKLNEIITNRHVSFWINLKCGPSTVYCNTRIRVGRPSALASLPTHEEPVEKPLAFVATVCPYSEDSTT